MVNRECLSAGMKFKFHHEDCEQVARMMQNVEYMPMKYRTAELIGLCRPVRDDCCWELFRN
jgi:hypothetical protein